MLKLRWFITLLYASIVIVMGVGQVECETAAPLSYISVDAKLNLEYNYRKLADQWLATKSASSYSFSKSTAATAATDGSFGQSLFLNVDFKPSRYFSLKSEFEFIGGYAERYWMPINAEHLLKNSGKSFLWRTADISYNKLGDGVRYFRGVGHYTWESKGDMFGLYPAQFNTEDYLRIANRPLPEGFEVELSGNYNSLDLVFGPEVVWGNKNAIYGCYNFFISRFVNTIVFRDTEILYGKPDERLRTYEFSTRFNPFMIGVLYQPFRIDSEYTTVTEFPAGTGLYGSNYIERTGKIGSNDALGASFALKWDKVLKLKDVKLQYTHLGLVAGNKDEFFAQGYKNVTDELTAGVKLTTRKPLTGPIPLIYQGTQTNRGPAIFIPRGVESPFTVNLDNREATIISISCLFDMTPKTWFYKYQPDVLENWNLNPEEDSKYSCAAMFTLEQYPTGTDRLTYYNENGNLVWEPATSHGAWPTKDFLGSFSFIGKVKADDLSLIWQLATGESVASGGLAYTTDTDKEKPITGYLSTTLTGIYKEYESSIRYAQDIWGPEEWNRTFGEVIDNLYGFKFSRMFAKTIKAGFEYTGVRESDDKYVSTSFGNYDEFRLFCTFEFGPVKARFK